MPTAVVIDGAFFLRRFHHRFPDLNPLEPSDVAAGVEYLAGLHVLISMQQELQGVITASRTRWSITSAIEEPNLYRIFFYDCQPLTKRVHTPVQKRSLNLATTPTAQARLAIHNRLLSARKVALRLGRLNDQFGWRPKPGAVEKWLRDPAGFAPTDDDFELDTVQKGVDMRLGLDVAAMAFKRQVSQIVLVAADADFVPAAKLARREGIDVVLDPMGGPAAKDLLQHVDGVRNFVVEGRL